MHFDLSHPLYLLIAAIWIILFGVWYLWLKVTGKHERLFFIIAAGGKLSFAGLLLIYWLTGELPMQTILICLADLFFRIVFLCWLSLTRYDNLYYPAK